MADSNGFKNVLLRTAVDLVLLMGSVYLTGLAMGSLIKGEATKWFTPTPMHADDMRIIYSAFLLTGVLALLWGEWRVRRFAFSSQRRRDTQPPK